MIFNFKKVGLHRISHYGILLYTQNNTENK